MQTADQHLEEAENLIMELGSRSDLTEATGDEIREALAGILINVSGARTRLAVIMGKGGQGGQTNN